MSEKLQTVREDESEDLLEQIITRGLEKMNAPAPEAAEESPGSETPSSPKQEDNGYAEPLADRKNRRNAVYLYLLILFGAAFLMLLLAYFIQQRNNADVLDDLRSTTASREELLDEIRELKEQNAALSTELNTWKYDLFATQEMYEERLQEMRDLQGLLYAAQEERNSWYFIWTLEQYYQAGDLQSCAAGLILQKQSQIPYNTPEAAQERYEEIVRAVIDAGILDEEYYLHPDDYYDLLDVYYSGMPVIWYTDLGPIEGNVIYD